MCGRFGLTRPERLDLQRFGVSALPPLEPRYNITPGTDVLVVRERKAERRADLLHWGLIPSWASDVSIGHRMINARSDTVFEKPAFRNAAHSRRCLIPADVFYEWQAVRGQRRKQPWAVRLHSGEPFAFGGLWEFWRPRDAADGIASCTILTTEPNALLAPIHDRMPVIIAPDQYEAWLDPETSTSDVRALLAPYADRVMEAWPITLKVNDPESDDASVLAPLAG